MQSQYGETEDLSIIVATLFIKARSKWWESRRGMLLCSHMGDTPCISISIDVIQ